MLKYADSCDSSEAEGKDSEKEWDKLLTSGGQSNEEPATAGQKYNNNGTGAKDISVHSSPFTTHSNVTGQGDNLNTQPLPTPIKLVDLEQMKLDEEAPPEPKKTNIKRKILKVVVTCMFITMAVGVIVIWTFHDGGNKHSKELSFFFDPLDMMVIVKQFKRETTKGYLGGGLFMDHETEPDYCHKKNSEHNRCYDWTNGNKVKFTYSVIENVACYEVMWETVSTIVPVDCYEVGKGHWYGMPSAWPTVGINEPLTTFQFGRRNNVSKGDEFNEYIWMSSKGVGIYLIGESPYLISFNESNNNRLCFAPDITVKLDSIEKRKLNYLLCQGYDVKQTHNAITHKYFSKLPQNSSNMQIGWLNDPLWSFNNNQALGSQNGLVDFASFLQTKDLFCNIIESRTLRHHDLNYYFLHSADIKAVTDKLSTLQCKLQLSISTMCSIESKYFQTGLNQGYFLLDSITSGIKLMQYENAQVAIWDISNSNFTNWFSEILSNVSKSYNIQHFKLAHIPPISMAKNAFSGARVMSGDYIHDWLDLLGSVAPILVTEGTFKSQDKPLFLEIDASVQTLDSGGACVAHTMSSALTSSIAGYPYLMSTAHSTFDSSARELYIRWLQMSVFFPALKIPSVFQNFGDEIITYTKNIIKFRKDYIKPCLQELNIRISESTPFIRPIWWIDIDPEIDYPSLEIGDEFLIGDNFLLAPIVCTNKSERSVYFPKGKWYSPRFDKTYEGRTTFNLKASLFEMLYFVNVEYAGTDGICLKKNTEF